MSTFYVGFLGKACCFQYVYIMWVKQHIHFGAIKSSKKELINSILTSNKSQVISDRWILQHQAIFNVKCKKAFLALKCYLLYLSSCTDDDECQGENICHGDANCDNREGSYICRCKAGFSGDGVTCRGQLTLVIIRPCKVNGNILVYCWCIQNYEKFCWGFYWFSWF